MQKQIWMMLKIQPGTSPPNHLQMIVDDKIPPD